MPFNIQIKGKKLKGKMYVLKGKTKFLFPKSQILEKNILIGFTIQGK